MNRLLFCIVLLLLSSPMYAMRRCLDSIPAPISTVLQDGQTIFVTNHACLIPWESIPAMFDRNLTMAIAVDNNVLLTSRTPEGFSLSPAPGVSPDEMPVLTIEDGTNYIQLIIRFIGY